jgi:hypothetical protein
MTSNRPIEDWGKLIGDVHLALQMDIPNLVRKKDIETEMILAYSSP